MRAFSKVEKLKAGFAATAVASLGLFIVSADQLISTGAHEDRMGRAVTDSVYNSENRESSKSAAFAVLAGLGALAAAGAAGATGRAVVVEAGRREDEVATGLPQGAPEDVPQA